MENVMPEQTSLFWGAIVSVIISCLKAVGLPDKFCPIVNVLMAGVGSYVYSVSTGKPSSVAILEGITAVSACWASYKAVLQPVGNKLNKGSE